MTENGSTSKPPRIGWRQRLRAAYTAIRDTVQFTRGRLDLDPRRDLSRFQRLLVTNLRVVFLTFRIEVYRRLELHAQALTFMTLLSLVPLFVVVFAILSIFGSGLENANQDILEYAIGYLSGSAELREEITGYLNTSTIREAELGVSTIIILALAVTSLLSHVENSFNTLFGVTAQRSVGVRLLSYWALLTLGPLLMLVSLALTAALQTSGFTQQVESLGPVGRLAVRATPLFVTWLAFTILYLTVPKARVRVGPAVLAALIAGSLWNLAKYIFAWYARTNVTVQDIYGSLAAFPLFVIWLYISWLLVLVGAQLCFAFQHTSTYQPEAVGLPASHAARERAACRLFYAIARDFFLRHPPTQVATAAQALGIPGRLQAQTISDLRQGELVIDTAGGGMVPARDLQSVTVADILRFIGHEAGHNPVLTAEQSGRYFDGLLADIDSEVQRIAGATTFHELIQRFSSGVDAAFASGQTRTAPEANLVAIPGDED